MKRIIIIISIILLSTSCSKESVEVSFSLVGKTYSAYSGKSVSGNEDMYEVYRFISTSNAEYTLRYNSPTGRINPYSLDTCKYSLEYPKITIFINGNTLIGNFIDNNTCRIGTNEYIKQ